MIRIYWAFQFWRFWSGTEAIINSQEQENSNDEIHEDSREECDDEKPLGELAGNLAPRIYCWRRQDTSHRAYELTRECSLHADTLLTPFQYFAKFLTNETLNDIVENTDIYLVQKRGKSVNTDSEKMKTFLGIQILMGIVQMPRYEAYWLQELLYSLLADAMSLKRYDQLRHFLHVFDIDALPDKETDKLAKIRPMIKAIRNQFVKVESEECHSVDEQIFPSKTKQSLPVQSKEASKMGLQKSPAC